MKKIKQKIEIKRTIKTLNKRLDKLEKSKNLNLCTEDILTIIFFAGILWCLFLG